MNVVKKIVFSLALLITAASASIWAFFGSLSERPFASLGQVGGIITILFCFYAIVVLFRNPRPSKLFMITVYILVALAAVTIVFEGIGRLQDGLNIQCANTASFTGCARNMRLLMDYTTLSPAVSMLTGILTAATFVSQFMLRRKKQDASSANTDNSQTPN